MGDFVFSLRWHLEMCNFGPRVLSPPLVTHLAYSSQLLSIIICGGSSPVIWPLTIKRADSRPRFTHQAHPHIQMHDMGGRCNFKVCLHALPPGLPSTGNYRLLKSDIFKCLWLYYLVTALCGYGGLKFLACKVLIRDLSEFWPSVPAERVFPVEPNQSSAAKLARLILSRQLRKALEVKWYNFFSCFILP